MRSQIIRQQQRFDTFEEWVNFARYVLTDHPLYNDGRGNDPWNRFVALCFDTRGRICNSGDEFQRARVEGTFPVRWVWPDQIPELMLQLLSLGTEGLPFK